MNRRCLSLEARSLLRDAQEAILQRSEADPRLLILYGSEARGEATVESDIDLLVVLERDEPRAVQAVREAVYDVMWKHDFTRIISLMILSATEFERQRRKGFSFIRNVQREGIVLWKAA